MAKLLLIVIILVAIVDLFIVGNFFAKLFVGLFGDSPLGRLTKVVCAILSVSAYGYWLLIEIGKLFDFEDVSFVPMIIALFLPLIVVFIAYVMYGENSNAK